MPERVQVQSPKSVASSIEIISRLHLSPISTIAESSSMQSSESDSSTNPKLKSSALQNDLPSGLTNVHLSGKPLLGAQLRVAGSPGLAVEIGRAS